MTPEQITDAQRRIREKYGAIVIARTRGQLRAVARWWELEAMRAYVGHGDRGGPTSAQRSQQYAANYRWLVEMYDAGRFSIRKLPIGNAIYVDGMPACWRSKSAE